MGNKLKLNNLMHGLKKLATRHKGQLIGTLTFICALQNVSLSQVGPFFPLEAKLKGVPEKYIGVIIGLNPLFYVAASFVMGQFLKRIG